MRTRTCIYRVCFFSEDFHEHPVCSERIIPKQPRADEALTSPFPRVEPSEQRELQTSVPCRLEQSSSRALAVISPEPTPPLPRQSDLGTSNNHLLHAGPWAQNFQHTASLNPHHDPMREVLHGHHPFSQTLGPAALEVSDPELTNSVAQAMYIA